MVSGDHLTMDRYRTLRTRHNSDLVGETFDWVLPLFGLFHMEMNYIKMLYKNHFGDKSGRDPSTLKCMNNILQTPGVTADFADFWAAMDLVNDTLDADIIGLVLSASGCRSFTDLSKKLTHNTSTDGAPQPKANIDFNWYDIVSKVADDWLRMDSVSKLRSGVDGEKDSEARDIVFENTLLRVRHSMQLRELYECIRAGDVGRLAWMLEILTPQFLGGKQYRYASELMEHMCGMRIEYSKRLKELIYRNWLINPFNKEGHFLAVDEFMEEIIRHVKLIYNPGGNVICNIPSTGGLN
jgi:hypothetical protein